MKKMLAMLLALMMALSCAGALAQEEVPPFTTYGALTFNEEMLTTLLHFTDTEIDEATLEILPSLAALLNNLGFYVSCADQSAQFSLVLKDTPVLTFAGAADEKGVAVVSDLFPNSAITVSQETMDEMIRSAAMPQMDAAKMEAAVEAHCEKLMADLSSYAGTPVPGEYTVAEGVTFNTQISYNITTAQALTLILEAVKAMMEDPALAPVFAAAGEMPTASDLDEAIASLQDPEEGIPELNMAVYANKTAGSPISEDRYATVTLGDDEFVVGLMGGVIEDIFSMSIFFGDAQFATMDEMIAAAVEGTGDAAVIDLFGFVDEAEESAFVGLDVYTQGMYIGFSTETLMEEDALNTYTELFFMDADNPLLAVETTTVHEGEALQLNLTDEIAAISLEALMNDTEGTVSGQLMMDIMMNGLNNVLASATEAMPDEVNALIELMSAPAETEEATTEPIDQVQ